MEQLVSDVKREEFSQHFTRVIARFKTPQLCLTARLLWFLAAVKRASAQDERGANAN